MARTFPVLHSSIALFALVVCRQKIVRAADIPLE
jgi:hypothetical protein